MSVEASGHGDDVKCTGPALHDIPVNSIVGVDGDTNHLHSLAFAIGKGIGHTMFDDKTVLITGAAAGIGAAIAGMFRDKGARLALADIRYDGVRTVGNGGNPELSCHCDVSDEASVRHMIERVTAELGPVDVLVNNVGIYPRHAFLDIDYAEWKRVLNTNLDSVFLLSRATIPGMLDRGWGRIINITSNTVYSGLPELSHYVASKSGMVGLTRCLATEFGGSGITCNCVAPNLTRTEGTHDLLAQNPGLVDMVVASQAIPRLQETADLLGAVRFLASEDSGFMTGQTLVVDGGTIKQ